MTSIFIIRHASPDRARTDIPYDLMPGPPLLPKGENEAAALAEFLRAEGVVKLYYSPFERSARTAKIVAAANGIPCIEEPGLLEWRKSDEEAARVRERVWSVFERIASEAQSAGSIGLVSHGAPVAFLLQQLGMPQEQLVAYRKMFDGSNPLPPAGAWKVDSNPEGGWTLGLAFIPRLR